MSDSLCTYFCGVRRQASGVRLIFFVYFFLLSFVFCLLSFVFPVARRLKPVTFFTFLHTSCIFSVVPPSYSAPE
jgi:hypothetical protein